MDMITSFLLFTRADSLGSIFIRGAIWLGVVLILAAGIDNGHSYAKIKAQAGWFFLFLFSVGLATYWIFGIPITF